MEIKVGLGGHGHTLVPRWIVHVALKLPTIHLTNGVTLKFNGRTILQNLCKDKDYFLHFKKIGTNVQNDYKDKDQNAYSLFFFSFFFFSFSFASMYLND